MELEPATRSWSFAVFNNRAFADVIVATYRTCNASPDGVTTARQVAAALGLADSVVRPVMQRMVAAGLLHARERVGIGNAPRPYQLAQLPSWLLLIELIAESLGVGAESLI